MSFRASDGLTMETKVKITAFDVREKVSQTATPIGSAFVGFNSIQDTSRYTNLSSKLLTVKNMNFQIEDSFEIS